MIIGLKNLIDKILKDLAIIIYITMTMEYIDNLSA